MPAARRKPRARRSAPPSAWRSRMPALEQRHWDLIGLALVAVAIFLAFLIYLGWDGGRGRRAARRRAARPRRRAPLRRAGRAAGRRRGARDAPRAAGRAAVPRRGRVPVRRPAASGCAAGTLGLGPATADGRAGRRAAARPDVVAAGRRRLAHHRRVPVPRRRAAAHGRERGERAQGDGRLGHARRARGAPGRRAGPHRGRAPRAARGAGRARGGRGHRGRRARAKQEFWSGAERFPDLYDGEPEPGERRGA